MWSFGTGDPTLCNPGPGSIIGTNDAERLSDGLTLILGTGIPPGASSSTVASSPGSITCSWTASGGGDLWDDVAIEIKANS